MPKRLPRLDAIAFARLANCERHKSEITVFDLGSTFIGIRLQAVAPSDIFSWPGQTLHLTGQSERTGIENKWFALTGRIVAVKAETSFPYSQCNKAITSAKLQT
jgi:hypothetical protein